MVRQLPNIYLIVFAVLLCGSAADCAGQTDAAAGAKPKSARRVPWTTSRIRGTPDPPLPYVYGLQEQDDLPTWLIKAVNEVRAKQPQKWAPGETPWPKAPKGAVASKMDGLTDEAGK